jgi:peptide/nickel transport system ATP-binding protein
MSPEDGPPLLDVAGLRIESRIKRVSHTIVDGIDLRIRSGETIGIVGESGSGKSLTARAIVGLLPPSVHATGQIRFRSQDISNIGERRLRPFRGRHVSLLFQDPYTLLNPLLRVGRQIMETARDADGRGLRGRPARDDAARRLAEVGLDPSIAEKYPFQLSGGMRQRVGIAAALASDPELLIADEPTTALDVTTQKEILELLRSIQRHRGMGLILITHDLRVAFSMCERIYVLYAGRVLEVAPAEALEREPLHPYSLALLLAEPPIERRVAALATASGAVPPPDEVAGICAFAARCAWRASICRQGAPPLAEIGDRSTACVRIADVRGELAAQRAARAAETPPATRPPSPGALLSIDGLRKSFGAHDALRGVSLEVHEGESVGLVGESGSGKTTLARCLVGLERPSAGSIVLGGIEAAAPGSLTSAQRRQLRSTVQIIFQDPYSSLNPARTVGATLREALQLLGESSSADVGELLQRVGLPASFARRKPAALSGGERQRVAIARAIAIKPRLIVCDEPVSALDVTVQAQILDLFRELGAELGVSYLFITHDLAVVRQVVDRVYVLYRGEVVEDGPVDDVLDRPRDGYTRELIASVPRTDAEWLRT